MFKFATILLIQILCGMELDLFIPSFPELQSVFKLSPFMVQLTISANFIAFCLCSLFAGALGDKYNRRTILILGLCLFVVGSILCVAAPNYSLLILGRILQGLGISAPAVLSFPVLLEDYASDKQPQMMGMINAIKTLAMAFAPVIGSFVNLYFNWRANFIILLIMGILCLLASYYFIPSKTGDERVSLSLKSYIPLLQSQKLLTIHFAVALLIGSYWLFMAMAPILYMEGFNMPLNHFGYYQGALPLTFAFLCLLSPKLLKTFGRKKCLYFGLAACFISAIIIMAMAIFQTQNPLMITAALMLLSLGVVFPINILYPFSLEIVPDAKGRSAGLGKCILLLLTASLIELVAYFYQGSFMPIGIAIFVTIMLFSLLIQKAIKNKWLIFEEH